MQTSREQDNENGAQIKFLLVVQDDDFKFIDILT